MWQVVSKGDLRCRVLADRHYSRQTPGAPGFCRPGYNLVLYAEDAKGGAVWVWFRPKWESGIKGTERKDGLRAIECTLFRNETRYLSSDMIREAVTFLTPWPPQLGREVRVSDGLISGVNSEATKHRRSPRSRPGECYLQAGWSYLNHSPGNTADVWLHLPFPQDQERLVQYDAYEKATLLERWFLDNRLPVQ